MLTGLSDITCGAAQIMDKVLAGDIDGAMAQTEALAPGTLEAHPSLLFRLHCQTFLELVRPPDSQNGLFGCAEATASGGASAATRI